MTMRYEKWGQVAILGRCLVRAESADSGRGGCSSAAERGADGCRRRVARCRAGAGAASSHDGRTPASCRPGPVHRVS